MVIRILGLETYKLFHDLSNRHTVLVRKLFKKNVGPGIHPDRDTCNLSFSHLRILRVYERPVNGVTVDNFCVVISLSTPHPIDGRRTRPYTFTCMNNTPSGKSSTDEWQMGLSPNEYYAYRQKMKRLRGDYTEEQLDVLDQMEKAWRASLPVLSLKELIDIYPGSEKAARRGIKSRIDELENRLGTTSLDSYRDVWHNTVINKAHFRDQPELKKRLEESVEGYLAEYEKEMKQLQFLLKTFNTTPEATVNSDGITDEMIALAKQIPIASMIYVRRDGKANCVWHKEKSPSMHVYKDNHTHCFGCGKTGDAIAVYMAMKGISFNDAVRQML